MGLLKRPKHSMSLEPIILQYRQILLRIGVILTIFTGFGCSSYYSTQALLDGNYLEIDTNPPLIVNPASGGLILNKSTTLVWSGISKAASYTIDIATDSGFTSLVVGSPFNVNAPTTSLSISVPDALTYYWRVRSNLSTKGLYSQATFEAMDDAVYVFCDAAVTCSDTNQIGNKSKPLRTIGKAQDVASSSGIRKVKVAARDTVSTAYAEAIVLVPQVSLYGGYKSDFKESNRSVAGNITRVYNDGVIALYAAYLFSGQQTPFQQVIVDGFTFETGITNTNTYAVYILQSSENLTIRNCTLKSGSSNGESYGLYLSEVVPVSSSNLIVENNFIKSGNPAQAPYSTFGIYVDAGSPIIRNNVIASGNITIGGSTGGSWALRIVNGYATVTNNTIVSGSALAAGFSVAVSMKHTITGSSASKFTNNIIYATAGAGVTYCFSESSINASPSSIQNNILSDCTNFYFDNPAGVDMPFWCAGLFGTTGGCGTTLTTPIPSGNVNIANFAATHLVGGGDYHLKSTTPISVKQGGKNVATGQNTCGAGTSSCGNVDTDRDGLSRTLPFSMGAYEMDL